MTKSKINSHQPPTFSSTIDVCPSPNLFFIIWFLVLKASISFAFFCFMVSNSFLISNIKAIGSTYNLSSFCQSFPVMLRIATMRFLDRFFFWSQGGRQNVLTNYPRPNMMAFHVFFLNQSSKRDAEAMGE